ncbi:hypothetical protein BGZ51_000211 [Haplosporangium sp. Z 767]|nr:hypothetical protein BGZ50_003087 [Haplosporangium sp. Z 11]KAF9188963.1 hypothetical protein BGZ51_000211 [Haplosporangium sp. Z 767]
MPLQSKFADLDSSSEKSKVGQPSLSGTHNTGEQANAPKNSSATKNKKRRAKKKKQKKQQQQELGQTAAAVPEDTSHPLLIHPCYQEPLQVDQESDATSRESPQKETTATVQLSPGNDRAHEAHKDLDRDPQTQSFSLGLYESATSITDLNSPPLPDSSSILKQSSTTTSGSTMFTPTSQYFKKPLPSGFCASQPTKTIPEVGYTTDIRIATTDSAEDPAMFSQMDSDFESDFEDLQQEHKADIDTGSVINYDYNYQDELEENTARLTEEKLEYEDIGIDPAKEAMVATARQQDDLIEQNHNLSVRCQRAMVKLNQMRAELALQDKSRQNAEEAYQQQIDNLKKQRRDLKTLMEELKKKEQEQRELATEATKKINKYFELATTQKRRADHCSAEVLRQQADLEDVNNMLTQTKEEYDNLEHQYAALKNRYIRLTEERGQHGNQQYSTGRIHALTREVMHLTVENQSLKAFVESHCPTSTQVTLEQTPSPRQGRRRPSLLEELQGAGVVLDSQPGSQSSSTTSCDISTSEHPQDDERHSQGNEATNEPNSQLMSLRSEPAITSDTPPSTQPQQQDHLPPNTAPLEHTRALIIELGAIRGLILDLDNNLQRSSSQLQRVLGFQHNQRLFMQQVYFQELVHKHRSEQQSQREEEARRPRFLSYIRWRLPICALSVVALFVLVDRPKFAATVQKLPSVMLRLVWDIGGPEFIPT